eukprot:gnl/TRDRNA2_/TRDRNA2_187384_c0_seq1.p1 gnl/TRDRNA2_/TRDRNA2_187384_c0~~gnl/TRDRNA2_/TRDRNA2_187384_c0_seq1.p1  ORF type:complete len:193 (-),score=20.48 gnl/TRDRNA2_/TRDRNA2_187384_c0_seq1:86-664(-)
MASSVAALLALFIVFADLTPSASLRVTRDLSSQALLDFHQNASQALLDVHQNASQALLDFHRNDHLVNRSSVNTMAVMIPDGYMYCMEGPLEYMKEATRKMKAGPLARFHKQTETIPGTCIDHGFPIDGGPDDCFKPVEVWWGQSWESKLRRLQMIPLLIRAATHSHSMAAVCDMTPDESAAARHKSFQMMR